MTHHPDALDEIIDRFVRDYEYGRSFLLRDIRRWQRREARRALEKVFSLRYSDVEFRKDFRTTFTRALSRRGKK